MSFISSHFLILSPNRSKFLWHQLFIAAWAAVKYCSGILHIFHSHKFSKTQRGHTYTRGGVKTVTTGVTFTAIGVRPFAAGVKTATEGSDLRPLWLSVTAAPILPWHSPKNKQGIPATPNMPKPLVFSGFPNILFMPFVSNKRFTFPHHSILSFVFFLLLQQKTVLTKA